MGKKKVKSITTEQFIQDNECLKNSYTADGRKLNISFSYKNNISLGKMDLKAVNVKHSKKNF